MTRGALVPLSSLGRIGQKEPGMATMDVDLAPNILLLSDTSHPRRNIGRHRAPWTMLARRLRVGGVEKRVEMRRFRRTNYYVSREGDVYSTSSERFLRSHPDAKGYHRITLQGATYRLHRLVYEAWVGGRPPVVHHRDGDPTNNSLDNLEGLSLAEHLKKHIPGRRAPRCKVCLVELPQDLVPLRGDLTRMLRRGRGQSPSRLSRAKRIAVSPTGRMCLRVWDDRGRLAEIPVSVLGWL